MISTETSTKGGITDSMGAKVRRSSVYTGPPLDQLLPEELVLTILESLTTKQLLTASGTSHHFYTLACHILGQRIKWATRTAKQSLSLVLDPCDQQPLLLDCNEKASNQPDDDGDDDDDFPLSAAAPSTGLIGHIEALQASYSTYILTVGSSNSLPQTVIPPRQFLPRDPLINLTIDDDLSFRILQSQLRLLRPLLPLPACSSTIPSISPTNPTSTTTAADPDDVLWTEIGLYALNSRRRPERATALEKSSARVWHRWLDELARGHVPATSSTRSTPEPETPEENSGGKRGRRSILEETRQRARTVMWLKEPCFFGMKVRAREMVPQTWHRDWPRVDAREFVVVCKELKVNTLRLLMSLECYLDLS